MRSIGFEGCPARGRRPGAGADASAPNRQVEDVLDAPRTGCGAVAEQAVGAAGGRARDAPRHGAHRAAELGAEAGRRQRPRALARPHDHDDARQRGDDAGCAPRTHQRLAPKPGGDLGHDRRRAPQPRVAAAAGRRVRRRRPRRRARRRAASPPASAPPCAASRRPARARTPPSRRRPTARDRVVRRPHAVLRSRAAHRRRRRGAGRHASRRCRPTCSGPPGRSARSRRRCG